MLELNCWTNP